MPAPRRIDPGATAMLTRRCAERRYFLRPCDEVNALVRYVVAVAAERHGVKLHGLTVLSDHMHSVVTDPHGHLPRFDQDVNALIARAMNARLGRWESFWAPGSYSAVTLVTPEDVHDKLSYVLANPVSAALVERAAEWPGVWTPPALIGAGPITVSRPDWFFRRAGRMPETAQLEFVLPPGFDSVDEFRHRLAVALVRREEQAAEKLAREGRPFMGVRKILAQSPFASPATPAPRRKLRPRIACLDPERRKLALAQLRRFLDGYRSAWLDFARGLRDVVFPYGTYWMRVAYRVRCEVPG